MGGQRDFCRESLSSAYADGPVGDRLRPIGRASFLDKVANRNLGRLLRSCGLALAVALAATGRAAAELTAADWPSFRNGGANHTDAKLPLNWSIRPPKNIAWTADLPGRGVSSPIIVEGRVIVTCSAGDPEKQLLVLAFDVETGQELWRKEFAAQGNTVVNELSAVAANTPATSRDRSLLMGILSELLDGVHAAKS